MLAISKRAVPSSYAVLRTRLVIAPTWRACGVVCHSSTSSSASTNVTTPRPIHPDTQKTSLVRTQIAEYHPQTIKEVEQAVHSNPIVVVGMSQNPFVKKVRKLLDDNKIPFKYLEYGSYLSQWKPRLAIKLWSGYPTFPQVFVNGVLIGGFDNTKIELENGNLKKWLEKK